MQTLHIRKFKARYRLPASARDERVRLDAALKMAMDETLDSELERLGFAEDEEICIRDVFVPIRLRLSGSVDAMAKAWGLALAKAIGRAASGGRVAGVVRYESRLQGLIDMAVGVALDDLGRVWAWRQLGLWQAGERVSEREALDQLIRALLAEPTTIVATISTLAGNGVLARLAPRFTDEHWQALAEAALSVAGISELFSESMMPPAPVHAATMSEASRLISTSRIARSKASTLAEFSTHHAEVQRAVAVLVVLESEQSALARGETEARLLVNAVMLALRSNASAASQRRGKSVEALREDERTRASVEFENQWEANDKLRSVPLRVPDASRAASASKQETRQETNGQENIFDAAILDATTLDATTLDATTLDATTFDATFDAAISEAVTSGDERPLPVVRRRAFTRFGGLLFLLGLMEDLGLPSEMSAYAAASERSFRWVLHRVALELTQAAVDDAAVLAFAGLLPDATPPSKGEDEPSDSETDVIASYAARIASELKVRLSDWRDVPPATLLHFVCRRRAEIVADPGWFEVRLSLDEVATEIRRAGLDLDAGYLRWLGVVVKFIYE